MFRIGLAGGIGSGKSRVAERMRELGAHVIEADMLARDIVAPGSPTLDALARSFGPSVIAGDGSLDRATLAKTAFSSGERLRELNEITWPPLIGAIVRGTEELERIDPDGILVVDAALLVQWDLLDLFDAVVVVTAPVEARIARLVASGSSREDVLSRIGAQMPEKELIAAADYVIENDGTLEQLRERVDALWRSLGRATDQEEQR
ncbi:MAG: dephospho-CoA kinase [Candidatus Eisenbacteria bacterium]|nr:dephospho-CoA kinase [Candidatus Eisenbacteria bacterium]